ncbi:MAG: DnaA N-terminal domain-containing protein, partial [Phenylobacterium sp.]|nr:DnaA N-terminal domain-containing protein [Phenylobacterium sp.]
MASGGLADRTTATPAGAVWTKTCLTLKRELGDATFGSWLGHAALRERSEHEVCLVAATGVARDWIRRHAWRRIGELWAQNDPEGRALDLKSRMEFDGAAPAEPVIAEVTLAAAQAAAAPVLTLHEAPAAFEAPAARPVRTHGLQERFTFDT